jgi:hypothetical protein
MKSKCAVLLGLFSIIAPKGVFAEAKFAEMVGKVTYQEASAKGPIKIPFFLWGGDVAFFVANGGLRTTPDSIYGKLKLDIQLVPGDDFVKQVPQYTQGSVPFLRGTQHQLALASEIINSDPRTIGVPFLQLTFSAGDHLVGTKEIKTIADFKGKRIAAQQAAPNLGLIDDALKIAKLTWDDVTIVWTKDISGPNGPAAVLKNNQADVALVISPDMSALCGDFQSVGTGAEGTHKGAHVVFSTREANRSVVDLLLTSTAFYRANRQIVEQIVAGYCKGSEQLVELKKQYKEKGSPEYMKVLKMVQDIYGKELIPTLDVDAHGLIEDARFVGLPGNQAFFTSSNEIGGFTPVFASAFKFALDRGYVGGYKSTFTKPDLNYGAIATLGGLTKTEVQVTERFKAEATKEEIEQFNKGELDGNTIYSFSISFEPDQIEFLPDLYRGDFQKIIEDGYKCGNGVMAIRAHADPSETLMQLVKAGMDKGVIKRTGSSGSWQYSFKGKPMDLSATNQLLQLIEDGEFDHPKFNPRETMRNAETLSNRRAENVRRAIMKYAEDNKLPLDKSQLQTFALGIKEPFIAKPSGINEAKQNMRVEFRLVRVKSEVTSDADFDY